MTTVANSKDTVTLKPSKLEIQQIQYRSPAQKTPKPSVGGTRSPSNVGGSS